MYVGTVSSWSGVEQNIRAMPLLLKLEHALGGIVAFGIMPAYRAARQDPVVCLRYE